MPILFDSSIYVAALRRGEDSTVILQRWARESPLWLSSVVLKELYAGADPSGFRVVEKLTFDT
jgi:predicted nucleic acid-binding protein